MFIRDNCKAITNCNKKIRDLIKKLLIYNLTKNNRLQ